MIAALLNRPQYFRIAFMVLLVFFTASKIAVPVYKVVKAVYKEFSETPSAEEDSAERIAGKDIASGQSFFQDNLRDRVLYYGSQFTNVSHGTPHNVGYPVEHHREITSPPPDIQPCLPTPLHCNAGAYFTNTIF